MYYKDLCDNQLIKLLAHDPKNEEAWSVFYYRSNKVICLIVNRFFKTNAYKDPSIEIEDVVQEVYKKLVKNECNALVVYEGKFENAFCNYLKTITMRILLNLYKPIQRRIPWDLIDSLDKSIRPAATNDFDRSLSDQIGEDDNTENNIILKEQIELCLDKIFDRKPKKNLYKSIFKLRIYNQLDAKVIAASPLVNRKYSTVKNILTTYKQKFIECLKREKAGK